MASATERACAAVDAEVQDLVRRLQREGSALSVEAAYVLERERKKVLLLKQMIVPTGDAAAD